MNTFVGPCRVRQIKTDIVIVHRRKGRSRIRSKYDIQFNTKGKWALLCGGWTTGDYQVNVTTKDSEVTCLKCLKRMQ